MGGDGARPVDLAAAQILIPLAQGDDQTEGERGRKRTEREEHGDVGRGSPAESRPAGDSRGGSGSG